MSSTDAAIVEVKTSDVMDGICPGCKHDLREFEPKLLPCLHTLCDNCISTDTSSVLCKICQNECRPEEIIVNQFIKDSFLQDDFQKDEQTSPTCTSCDDDADSTSYCSECMEWLCNACVQAHQRVRVTKDHVIQSKDEVIGEQTSSVPQKTLFCHIHKQEQLKLFCETCDQLTCRDCQLLEHRDHRYQFISEASNQHKLYLHTLLEKLQEKKSYMEAAKALITKRYKDISQREQIVTNEIKMFAIRFITEINRRGKYLLAELHNVCSHKKAALGDKNKELSGMSEKLDHCLQFVESIVNRSSDVALLYSKRTITNQLRNILRSHCEVPNPNHIVDIRFVYENAYLSNYINEMGGLMVDNQLYNMRMGSHSGGCAPFSPSCSSPANNCPLQRLPTPGSHPSIKQAIAASFGSPSNSNHPLVSSSTHPIDMQRNIRLRNLLEQSPSIPSNIGRTGNVFTQPGILKNQTSPLIQNNSALFRMLLNVPSPNQPGSLPSSETAISGENVDVKIPLLMPNGPGSVQSDVSLGLNVLSLTKTQRLSHYPTNVSFANATPCSTNISQELHMPSPHSSSGSPGLNSASSTQIMNVANQHSTSLSPNLIPFDENPKCDLDLATHSIHETRDRNSLSTNTTVKHEMTPSIQLSSCNMNPGNVKPEIAGDAQEISNTACQAMSFFCNDSLNIMGSLKSFPIDEANVDEVSNDVDSIKIIDVKSNLNKVFETIELDDSDENVVMEKETIQQADSSCSPGLLLLECSLNENSLDNPARGLINKKNTICGMANTPNGQSGGKNINNLQEQQNQDPNDDWCAVCHDGGDLLCCGHCPRVYHLGCHIPSLSEFPGQEDQWQCLMCRDNDEIHRYIIKETAQNTKRKNCVGLSGHELRSCERILLELFCSEGSFSFHHPVSRAEAPDYHKIITNPMDLGTIKKKLSPCHFNHYDDVKEVCDDLKLMFRNCFTYNEAGSVVFNSGKKLEQYFLKLVNQYLPSYEITPWEDAITNDKEDNYDKDDDEPPGKKKKLDYIIW